MNVQFKASETEIKMRFRKLASIYHPDKNYGSKNAEETFKVILNAYETLINKERRAIYDIKYEKYFQLEKTEQNNKNNNKQDEPKQPTKNKSDFQYKQKSKIKVNYRFLIVAIILTLLYLYNANKTTTTGNPKADQQLEEQPINRPQSGEIDFNK